MNRKFMIMLLCVLVATSVALAACQPEAPEESTGCAAHSDVNNDGLCDNCGIKVGFTNNTTAPAGNVPVSFSVFNDEQMPMTGATVTITDRYTQEVFTATVGADGTVTVELPESDYSVGLEDLPEYHVAGFKTLEVMPDMDTVALNVVNNTPNGSAERPFFIGSDVVTQEFAADSSLYFTMRFDWGRALIIDNPNVEVTVHGETFTADANGRVEVRVDVDDDQAQEHMTVIIANKGETQTLNMQPVSDPGTLENPFALELGKDTTAQVVDGNALTYAWTATADGVVTVSSDTDISSLKLNNLTNSTSTAFTNDVSAGTGPSASLEVKAGDQITVEVTVTASSGGEYDEVVFKLTQE